MASRHKDKATGLDTGAAIRKVLRTKRITHAALARAVGRAQSNISVSLAQRSLHAYILWEMSVALRHNLFADLAAQLNHATEGRLQQDSVSVEALQAEIERLRTERDTLMRAVEKLSR